MSEEDREKYKEALDIGYSYDQVFDEIEQIVNEHDGWIRVKDRMPLESDTDNDGKLLAWDSFQSKAHKVDLRDVYEMKMRFKHWQPLPSPPKQ